MNKWTVVVAVVGLIAISVAFIFGIITGANNAGGALVQDQPNQYCVLDSAEESKIHAETKLVACQIVGMTEDAAVRFAEDAGLVTRVAFRDGESFALTEDYTETRINLGIILGVITTTDAW